MMVVEVTGVSVMMVAVGVIVINGVIGLVEEV